MRVNIFLMKEGINKPARNRGYEYVNNDDWLYEEVSNYNIEPARETLEEIRDIVGYCKNEKMKKLLQQVEKSCVNYARVVQRFRMEVRKSGDNLAPDKINTQRTAIHDIALERLGDLLEMIQEQEYELTTELGRQMEKKLNGIADRYRAFFGYKFMIMTAFVIAEENQE